MNSNEIFVGNTLPENPKEHLETFEDIFDGLYTEMDRNEAYINEIKSDLEEDNNLLGELLKRVSDGEAGKDEFDLINSIKDSIVGSKNNLSKVLHAQNSIREYVSILREMRGERDKKITTLKNGQEN